MNQHTPEGISLVVDVNTIDHPTAVAILDGRENALAILAAHQAATTYPGTRITGRVLHVELNADGEGRHEVVLEVA
jgi:hypothetical protein